MDLFRKFLIENYEKYTIKPQKNKSDTDDSDTDDNDTEEET